MTTPRRRTPRLPTPETLRDQVVLEEHDLAPDGSFAVVAAPSRGGRGLCLAPVAGATDDGEPRR